LHIIRKQANTWFELLDIINGKKLDVYMRRVQGSRESQKYQGIGQNTVMDEMLGRQNQGQMEEMRKEMHPQSCIKCGELNSPHRASCYSCGGTLKHKELEEKGFGYEDREEESLLSMAEGYMKGKDGIGIEEALTWAMKEKKKGSS
jgi:ribosomal protein L32